MRTLGVLAAWGISALLLAAVWLLALAKVADAHPGVRSGSTAYCLNGTMADGTQTRAGSVAHNGYRLGTKLTISPSPTGRRFFVVRDRIGYGTELDIWTSTCGAARAWGRRGVVVRVGWHHAARRSSRAVSGPWRSW
jgi:3D (Asp-Asp-Asp) domain-containing protein